MATLINPITRLMGTLRQWRDRERPVVMRELAEENRAPDLYAWRQHHVPVSAYDDRVCGCGNSGRFRYGARPCRWWRPGPHTVHHD